MALPGAGGSGDISAWVIDQRIGDESPSALLVQLFTQVRVLNASFREDLRAFRSP